MKKIKLRARGDLFWLDEEGNLFIEQCQPYHNLDVNCWKCGTRITERQYVCQEIDRSKTLCPECVELDDPGKCIECPKADSQEYNEEKARQGDPFENGKLLLYAELSWESPLPGYEASYFRAVQEANNVSVLPGFGEHYSLFVQKITDPQALDYPVDDNHFGYYFNRLLELVATGNFNAAFKRWGLTMGLPAPIVQRSSNCFIIKRRR